MMARRCLVLLSVILCFNVLAACGKPTPAPLSPTEIMGRSAARMKALSSFHFVIDRSGAPAFLDQGETIAFRRAEGDYVAPDRARARVRVIAPGLVAEVQVISIGPAYWETDLLTSEWHALPSEMSFNPAVIFDPQIGIQPILETDASALELTGIQELAELPGKRLYSIKGELNGERLFEMSNGLIGPDRAMVQLWIAPDTFDLYRIVVVEPATLQSDQTTWQVDFWDLGKKVDIQPPSNPKRP